MKNQNGIDPKIVVSSRIRLARNLKQYPFPSRISEEDAEKMKKQLREVFRSYPEEEFDFLDMENVTSVQAGAMVEEHLISPEFARRKKNAALVLGRKKCLSVMINEEDHLRIQAMSADSDLEELYRRANALDDHIDAYCEYAFSEKYGYLTACPTNLGTAMRASVMLHLPALTERGLMDRVIQSVSQLGVTVRGIYGEGTQAGASLYQVSNAASLGIGETETLQLIRKVVAQICEAEQQARGQLYSDLASQDELFRAYGILKECRMISSAEFRSLYSKVRLAAGLGLLTLNTAELDRLFTECQPYNLMLAGASEGEAQRDRKRADLIRERLNA